MTGSGRISASGGNGFAGGGGGRVSVNAFSRHEGPSFYVHGGRSFGCPTNSGAAGTFFDAVPRRLIINNQNMSTYTDTLLVAFPKQPLWTNVYIQNHACATVPLLWSCVQIYGALRMSVKIHLMLNSKMLIDGDGDAIVGTSLIEVSNLVVLKGSSVIHSNANLGVRGQGSLNVTGSGNLIEARHLVLSLFYSISEFIFWHG